jgi:23S rRNA (guanine2445-N2)-methyltransferase / 23S rRNA (guanine2069-N7)-methyltransferase
MSPAFATTPRLLEEVLERELLALGLEVRATRGGVFVGGGLEGAYRACLWSRVASRVLWPLATFDAPDPDTLYREVRALDWTAHLPVRKTFAVDAVLVRSRLGHSHFVALRVKDGVVDQLREARGSRPNVDVERPDLRLNLFVSGTQATLSVDLAGESLHRRGYRSVAAAAPVKENLAAALLLMADWPAAAAAGRPFLDPLCGSGTFPIEAALIALDVAPGLLRPHHGLEGWAGHDPETWQRVVAEARARDRRGAGDEAGIPPIVGFDGDPAVVSLANGNAERAGVGRAVRFAVRDLAEWEPPAPGEGVLVMNPPYGKRLSEVEALRALYRTLGDLLKQRFAGWTAHILSGSRELDGHVGLRATRRQPFFNGPIECRLLTFPLHARREAPTLEQVVERSPLEQAQVEELVNRLRKRASALAKWAAARGVTCYRVYDADIPAFNAAIDRYEDAVHVQEYAAPPDVDDALATARRRTLLAVVPEVLGVAPEAVFFKMRERQCGRGQYQKQRELGHFMEVREGGHRFLVNLTDYLDTGLFLDHRDTRARLQRLASGRSFLNLFAYTGTATVYAAKGGATRSVSVDRSKTYLVWARRNFELNGLEPARHQLVLAEVGRWLPEQRERFGLIFLDPPTFSNRKDSRATLDVQRDHVLLLRGALALLEPDGILVFSTHSRRFELDVGAVEALGFEVTDLHRETLPQDFSRRPNIHQVFELRRRR